MKVFHTDFNTRKLFVFLFSKTAYIMSEHKVFSLKSSIVLVFTGSLLQIITWPDNENVMYMLWPKLYRLKNTINHGSLSIRRFTKL